ncbi:MAG TPA: hypothetical protein VMZ27_03280 [Candidatus Saccharimonadales bacterium]|nr:hypothetical protein [Candidatus Saccharimonadales bacterium]
MNEDVVVENVTPRPPSLLRRVSWGAIFAGLLVTIVVQMMLTLLGIGLGAASIDPLKEQNPGQGLALGSAIWLIVSALIATFIGACISGRLSGAPRTADGLLHGVVTWSAATVLTVAMLVSAAGVVIGGATTLLSGLVKGGASAAQNSQSGSAMQMVQDQIKQAVPNADVLSPTGRESGPTGQLATMAKQNPQLAAVLAKMEKNGGASQSPAERDQAVQMLTQQGLNQQQAAQLVSQWDQQVQQAKVQVEQKTREVGDKAAKGVSRGAIMGFVALLLELGVAAWGGWVGAGSLSRIHRGERFVPARGV